MAYRYAGCDKAADQQRYKNIIAREEGTKWQPDSKSIKVRLEIFDGD